MIRRSVKEDPGALNNQGGSFERWRESMEQDLQQMSDEDFKQLCKDATEGPFRNFYYHELGELLGAEEIRRYNSGK